MSWPPDDRLLLVHALSQAAAGRRLDWRFHTFKFSSFSRKDSKGGSQVYSESEDCILESTFLHLVASLANSFDAPKVQIDDISQNSNYLWSPL